MCGLSCICEQGEEVTACTIEISSTIQKHLPVTLVKTVLTSVGREMRLPVTGWPLLTEQPGLGKRRGSFFSPE